MSSIVVKIAKAGVAGHCAVILFFFGIFLLFTGTILVANANADAWQDDFFEDTNRYNQISYINCRM